MHSKQGAEKKTTATAREAQKRARPKRHRTGGLRRQSGLDTRRKVAPHETVPALARLLQVLEKERIRFLIAGMSAAVLQGVPYTTLDTDIWINLPSRQYLRVLNLCRSLGAVFVANTVVILEDGTTVNFLYRVDGLNAFVGEYRKALQLEWMNRLVRVLPVERILKSKETVGRPKDVAHLPILRTFLQCRDS
jgi:hypothetical protein